MKNNFKPMLVQFDEQGYKGAETEAINKLKLLDEAKVCCEKYIDVNNLNFHSILKIIFTARIRN